MTLLSMREAPDAAGAPLCRVPLHGPLTGLAVFGGILLALAWAIENGHLPAFFWVSVVLLAPIVLFVIGRFWAVIRGSNRLLWCAPDALYIQFRSYENYQFDRDTLAVVAIPYKEIDRVDARSGTSEYRREGSENTFRYKEETLLLEVVEDTGALAEAIAAERVRKGKTWYGSSRSNSDAVDVPRAGLIRVGVCSRTMRAAPDAERIVDWLGKHGVAHAPIDP